MSALAGRTVLVTRARDQAGALCATLESRGARAVAFPTIEIRPVAGGVALRAAAALDSYHWIAFASANAVRCWWEVLRAAGRAGIPAHVRVAAVGPATGAALAEHGVAVTAWPGTFRGTALAAAMGMLHGRRVLLPGADIAREETAAALREAGAVVDDVTVYRTETAHPDPAALGLLDEPVDAVTFTSPSTVRGFLAAGGARATRRLAASPIACIGPTTGDAVRALGLPVAVEPARHTVADLVEALESFFASAPVAPAGGAR